jgi:hypothetical protein
MKLNETLQLDPVRGLIYGRSGDGKTSLLGLLALHPELRPIYVFDWDLRIGALRARLPSEIWQYVESDPYRDITIPGEAFTHMQSKMEKVEKEGFKSVIIDSMTFAMKGIMSRVLNLDGKPPTSTPQLQNYMAQMSLAEDTVARACGKKFNFFITCHEDTSKDEVTGRLFKSVDLTGKMAQRIPGYFNELWHCEVAQVSGKEAQFVIRTRSDQSFGARTSYKSLANLEQQNEIWPKIIKERAIIINTPTTKPADKVDSLPSSMAKVGA